MSKLSKFKYGLTPVEAAKLLARLIGEDVSTEDLESLHANDWLNIKGQCRATIVKLKPALDNEEHAILARQGKYLMTEDENCGLCLEISLPMDMIDIVGSGRSFVLRDSSGCFYALRDQETDLYLNDMSDNLPYFDECLIEPSDIFKIAAKANNDDPLEPAKNEIKINNSCIADISLYNFTPDDDQPKVKHSLNTELSKQPPSRLITVAALLEITTQDRRKHTQASLISEILEKNAGIRGLSQSGMEKYFAEAKGALTEARKSK